MTQKTLHLLQRHCTYCKDTAPMAHRFQNSFLIYHNQMSLVYTLHSI